MIDELGSVVLTADLPQHGLRAGDLGVVVLVHEGGAGYTIEFTTVTGATVAVVTLSADQVRPLRASDIAHVREQTAAAS
jgi:hypothetical protein